MKSANVIGFLRGPRSLVACSALALASSAHCSGGASDASDSAASEGVSLSGAIHPFASSGLCLDVVGQSTANGAGVQVWWCTGNANQQWTYDGSSLRVYGNKCLDVTRGNTADGTKLQIWDCAAGNPNQKWTLSGSTLQWAHHGKCLDLTRGLAKSGTLAQSWTCYAGDTNQEWSFAGGGGSSSGSGSSGGGSGSGSGGGSGGSSSGGSGGGSCPPSWSVTPKCGGGTSSTPPDLGPNVLVFDPSMSMSSIESRIAAVYAQQDKAQFGTGRYAFFFKPGHYSLDVKVGFYTQVVGLGRSPDDVSIQGAVRAKADWLVDKNNNNATCNFWRGAENLAVTPSSSIDSFNGQAVDIWAISQGTHLRRVHVNGNLRLEDGGWSSGGFIADSLIDGTVYSGSQQQFLTRNDDMHWQGSNWNMVFVGDRGAPSASWPNPPYTVAARTPLVREKPFLYLDPSGDYLVMVPGLKSNSQGHSWASGAAPGVPLSIGRFYIAKPGDTAAAINAALAQGKHLLFTPGVYHLESSLQITQPGTVVLGLGLATLIPDNGTSLLSVADVDGVTLAGLLLEAGPNSSPTLLELGPGGSSKDHSANPTAVLDVHCRVGGADVGTASSCVTVNSNHVLIDNAWLWRADHGAGAAWNGNVSNNGIIVNGNDVTAYGLFVEHFQQYQTLWNGNGGSVYLYQSELPYDPPNQAAWTRPTGQWGWPSFKVASGVTSHHAEGLGVYSVFSNYVTEENAIEAPTGAGISMNHMVIVSLASGAIQHVINDTFGPVGNGTLKSDSSY